MAELDQARAFIAAANWRFAETMPDNPHEWVHVRSEGGPGFDALVALIKAGPVGRYQGRPYRYATIDGHVFWLTWGGGYIINRKSAAEAGWDRD